jgi:hypothetical protein
MSKAGIDSISCARDGKRDAAAGIDGLAKTSIFLSSPRAIGFWPFRPFTA